MLARWLTSQGPILPTGWGGRQAAQDVLGALGGRPRVSWLGWLLRQHHFRYVKGLDDGCHNERPKNGSRED